MFPAATKPSKTFDFLGKSEKPLAEAKTCFSDTNESTQIKGMLLEAEYDKVKITFAVKNE